jgi:hypothetical protein
MSRTTQTGEQGFYPGRQKSCDPVATQAPPDLATRPYCVYRLYNADGDLLYVGLSNGPLDRFRAHAGDKTWWTEVARIDLTHVADGEEAHDLEATWIKDLDPRYNKLLPLYLAAPSGPCVERIRYGKAGCERCDGAGVYESDTLGTTACELCFTYWEIKTFEYSSPIGDDDTVFLVERVAA